MYPTHKRLLDWAAEMAAIYEQSLGEQPNATTVERAIWASRRDAYLNVRTELALSLPRLIDEATLLPLDEEAA